METKATSDTCQSLFARWRQEHDELDQVTGELRQWTYEVGQVGIPHFGEAGDKLAKVRQRLVEHFKREEEIGQQLLDDCKNSAEAISTCRSASQDHEHLLGRITDLIVRLQQPEAPFESWQQAVREVELFLDALEQHEEHEEANITWLAPPPKSEST